MAIAVAGLPWAALACAEDVGPEPSHVTIAAPVAVATYGVPPAAKPGCDCTADANCVPTEYCAANICTAKKADGAHRWTRGEPSLEDVFILLMNHAKDNFA